MAHINRKEYFIIFVMLALLTALEVGVVYIPGIGKVPLVTALCGLAIAKAALVGLYFMHLKYETKVMKLTVVIPLAVMPIIYAAVLITEAQWRILR